MFKETFEQILNHILPALGGVKPNLGLRVEHCEEREMQSLALARLA